MDYDQGTKLYSIIYLHEFCFESIKAYLIDALHLAIYFLFVYLFSYFSTQGTGQIKRVDVGVEWGIGTFNNLEQPILSFVRGKDAAKVGNKRGACFLQNLDRTTIWNSKLVPWI